VSLDKSEGSVKRDRAQPFVITSTRGNPSFYSADRTGLAYGARAIPRNTMLALLGSVRDSAVLALLRMNS